MQGKKTLPDVKGIVELPHPIKQRGKRTIMAFVKVAPPSCPLPSSRTRSVDLRDTAVATKAREAGAELIGTPEMIKKVHPLSSHALAKERQGVLASQIIKGQINLDDVDYFVAYGDMLADIVPLRGILRHKFPTKLNSPHPLHQSAPVKGLIIRRRAGERHRGAGEAALDGDGV